MKQLTQKPKLKFTALALVIFCLFLFAGSQTSAATSNPRVVQTVPAEIAELPRTGIPLLAWGLAALVPIGYKLKNGANQNEKNDKNSSPHSLWIKRQLEK